MQSQRSSVLFSIGSGLIFFPLITWLYSLLGTRLDTQAFALTLLILSVVGTILFAFSQWKWSHELTMFFMTGLSASGSMLILVYRHLFQSSDQLIWLAIAIGIILVWQEWPDHQRLDLSNTNNWALSIVCAAFVEWIVVHFFLAPENAVIFCLTLTIFATMVVMLMLYRPSQNLRLLSLLTAVVMINLPYLVVALWYQYLAVIEGYLLILASFGLFAITMALDPVDDSTSNQFLID